MSTAAPSSSSSHSASPVRVFLSFFPHQEGKRDRVSPVVSSERNRLAQLTRALQLRRQPPSSSSSAPFLFLLVQNVAHPLQKLRDDDLVLYVPTARYRALVEEADSGRPPNEEVEAVRRKALAAPHSVIAVTFHPTAMDGVDSPDYIPPSWSSAHFSLFLESSYEKLLAYLQQLVADPGSARVFQPPSLTESALMATSRLDAHTIVLGAQPSARVKRLLARDGRLRVFLSFAAHDPELTAFHPQAVQLLAGALNAHALFDCRVHSLDDTDSDEWAQWMAEEVARAHCLLFFPTARYRQRAAVAQGGVAEEVRLIGERARTDERGVVCVTFPTVAAPLGNVPQGWPEERYDVTGSEQSLQRLVYRLMGVEKGVTVFRAREASTQDAPEPES